VSRRVALLAVRAGGDPGADFRVGRRHQLERGVEVVVEGEQVPLRGRVSLMGARRPQGELASARCHDQRNRRLRLHTAAVDGPASDSYGIWRNVKWKLVDELSGPDLALLLLQEGGPMVTVELRACECDRQVVVALSGELDVADAVSVAAALEAVAAGQREIIIDLTGLEFIDSSGLAALVRARKQARHGGGDVLLVAPQRQVLRFLSLIRLVSVFSIHASVDEAIASAGSSGLAAVPVL
jgi:anti-sigma B factor antagonist